MSKYAWVTLATNDSYSLGALVVAHSLKRVHTVHQMAVLITPGVSEAMKTKLRAVFNVVEEVNLLDSKDAANLALLKRPELGITFTKLHCWRLTQFEKCVFLDADTLVLRNSDELFEREELSAAPDIGWPDCFNSGVYVFRPNLETFSSLLQYAVTHGSFDGGDQGLLNAYFSDWAHKDIQKHLPFIYNTSSVATYSYLPAFKQFGQNTKILHFIGTVKPWLQNFNSETRKVYVPSEYQHLANFLQFWWDIFAEDVHSRLSPDMQRALTHWIKPLHKVSVNQSRSAPLSTTFFTHEADNASQMPYWQYQDNYQHHHQHHDHHDHQQQQREGFVVSYDPEKDFKDPWEDYLQRQEREKVLRKQEEERLYFQYLNELRAQEHRSRTQYESSLASHHDQSPYHVPHHDAPNAQQHQDRPGADGGYTERDHHHNHHDNNAFQRTEQWVDRMVQQHQENVGHWEKQSGQVFAAVQHQDSASYSPVVHHTTGGEQMSNRTIVHDSNNNFTTAGDGNANVSHKSTQIQEHETVPPSFSQQEPSNQRQPTGSEESNAAGGNVGDVTGLAGALAQLHLGEAKSKEQEAYEEHMRRQCWETGNIDYMGRDSFENIWKRIQQTLNTGTGSGAEEKESATVQTVSPAVTQRTSRRPSRSRSATPKRDPKDRSPTPQPEEKIPVDKKEVHHVVPPPVIAEEDDVAIRLSSIESAVAMRTQAKLPPPIQYDPTTNTTTLTKKVFAGYRQIITTKNPEGKTRTHEKLVYDPSIDDDQPATVVDATQLSVKQNVGGEVGTTSTATTTTTTVPIARAALSQKQSEMPSATVPSAVERQLPSSVPAETSAYQPTIPKSPPKHVPAPVVQPTQQQQQVAQESIAGKTNALQDTKQPVKALRKKRHISPQSRPQQTTTNAASTDQVPGKPSTPSPSPRSSSLTSASRNDQQEKASVASAIISPSVSSSMAKTITTPSPLADAQVASVLTPTARDKTLTAVQQQTLPLNIPSGQTKPNNQPVEGVKVGSPPVPPRRKRESRATKLDKTKKSKLVQLLLSCISCSKKKR